MTVWIEFLKEAFKILGFGLAGGVTITGALALVYLYYERRVLVRLGRLACPFCARSFGYAAARDAKQRYNQACATEMADIVREHGEHVMVDFNHRWEVGCPHCGRITKFDSLKETLENAA